MKKMEVSMIDVEKLEELANKRLEHNYKFRVFLKNHADSEKLDEQFKELHEKYFAQYDCSKCRNCCKKCSGSIPVDEVEEDAKYLNIDKEEFIEKYLDKKIDCGEYHTKNAPCDFFVNGECILDDHKPLACKEYPHTNKDNRLFSLYSVVDNTTVCPVVYEILEELKKMYRFR